MALLAHGRSDEQAVHGVERWLGPLTAHQRRSLLREARGQLLERLGRARDEHRAEALAHYQAVLASAEASTRDKLHARRRIDQLLGLEPPRAGNNGRGDGAVQNAADEAKLQAELDAMLDDPEIADAAVTLGERLARRLWGEDTTNGDPPTALSSPVPGRAEGVKPPRDTTAG